MPAQKKEPAGEKTYNVGDIVLGRIKSYPPWPGHIIRNEDASPLVAKSRPKNKNVHLVEFFPTADYAWLTPRDLSPLTDRQIDAFCTGNKKQKTDIYKGYQIALDPTAWLNEQAEYKAVLANEEEMADDDQLDSEGEGESKDKDKSKKKRKRPSEAGEEKAKAPEDKKAKKAKLEKLAEKRTAGAKAAAAASGAYSEDESTAAPAPKKVSTPKNPEENEDPGLKQVRDWRHKLQKVFLGKHGVVADEVAKCKEYFDKMEGFEMNKEWLSESKLAKVLKRVALLSDDQLPQDGEYSFRKRALDLTSAWAKKFASEPASTPPAASSAPTTNGDAKIEDVEMKPAAADAPAPASEKVAEPTPAPAKEEFKSEEAPKPVEEASKSTVEEAKPVEEVKPAEAAAPAPAPQTNGVEAEKVEATAPVAPETTA